MTALLALLLMLSPVTITNGTQFGGVHAHGGGVLKAGAYYYWFGENRNADDTFNAVSVYRSTDLRTWEFRADVLTRSSASELASAKIERPKVIYNASTGKYVMWMHKENGSDYGEARAAVAVSDTIDGDYAYEGSFRPFGSYMSRDITLYQEGSAAYMISAADENRDLMIYRLTADYRNVASVVGNFWNDASREAPALFKRGSTYFMLTSGTSGWNPNQSRCATAPSITGPWTGWTDVGDATTYHSQPAFVLQLGNSYLYLGDRWAGAWGAPVNNSEYVWLPITFPTSTSMSLSWSPAVTVDAAAGTVSGSAVPYHRVTNRSSSKVLDVWNASTADNAEVKTYAATSGTNQQWDFRTTGGGYLQVINRNSGKCLDVASGSTAEGANIIQYACGAGANQQWQWIATGGYHQLKARHSGKCLTLAADAVDLQQATCSSATTQQWSRATT
ncbi:hypothetical protein BJY16_003698 [Actinoplanes octamycinicus]|uniref:Ricin B lectin domain-containing protein n=1 Tax=Actinoplanes octamycinicus TaxID=135948 RepID=A0A7W7M7V6_9ACTN|nr:RICIN domain-containing protein [Actinoplanes octamycinicus]MBB4740239.1 hypothetical protein [Actinoplanes octamycinicus]GIE59634.1 beta-xylosidase [Actinoplanes octamycinicus]